MSKLLAHSTEESTRTEDVLIKEATTFDSLLLKEELLKGLKECGFVKPSPIQLKAIPVGRCGFGKIYQKCNFTYLLESTGFYLKLLLSCIYRFNSKI